MSGRLYALLPTAIRQADAAQPGAPLQALLAVIETQADLLHADIAQLYENWFIETCAEWLVPYIGDLVGYRPAPGAPVPTSVPRSDVADTIRNRRRKGTLGILATLARDVTGWPAVAIEFEHAVAATFSPLAPPAARERTLDVRDAAALARLRDPRSTAAHGVATRGRYTIGSVGLVVSRLHAQRVSRSDAACVVTQGDHCYTFDALGFDAPLVSALQPLPAVLRPQDLAREYGPAKSVALWTRPAGERTRLEPVPLGRVVAADLTHWRFRPAPGDVAIDVRRGRLSFAPGHAPDGVVVRYHTGAAADIGAGEYPRELAPAPLEIAVAHGGREEQRHLHAALKRWSAAHVSHAAIAFGDSHVYDESDVRIELPADAVLELRADDGARPVLRIEDRSAGHLDALRIRGGPRSRLILDGLVIARRGIEISGEIGDVIVRRCTLVPAETPIVLRSPTARLTIEQSIIGDIRAIDDETRQLPNVVTIRDSIVGAHGREDAIGTPDAPSAFIDLHAARSTFFGRVRVHGIGLVEDCIFVQQLAVRRRETGNLRYSYLGPHSKAPAGYACVTEPAPIFMSRTFGSPGYARLAAQTASAIAAGGQQQGEMGAYARAQSGYKAANLAARLREFVPPGITVEISYGGIMKGDFSRDAFDAGRQAYRVLQQQGRVQLDADWNEQTAIVLHRLETMLRDAFGAHGGPADHCGFTLFAIENTNGDFGIGVGRYYVDGLLVENGRPRRYTEGGVERLEAGRSYIVYLDVWEEFVAPQQDPAALDPALDGLDTTAHTRIAWHVWAEPVAALPTRDAIADGWPYAFLAPSLFGPRPRLAATTGAGADPDDADDPALGAVPSGYRGAENHLYRVEIHDPGTAAGGATFKWSRDNGAVALAVTAVAGNVLTVEAFGRDAHTTIAAGDWVEIVDDEDAGARAPARGMLRVASTDTSARTVTLKAGPSYAFDAAKHPVLRRWDQRGGAIPVIESDADDGWMALEDGIFVRFAPAAAGDDAAVYRCGDYWLIPARVADGGTLLWPNDAQGAPALREPAGVRHHYAPIAGIAITPGGALQYDRDTFDYRRAFRPLGTS